MNRKSSIPKKALYMAALAAGAVGLIAVCVFWNSAAAVTSAVALYLLMLLFLIPLALREKKRAAAGKKNARARGPIRYLPTDRGKIIQFPGGGKK